MPFKHRFNEYQYTSVLCAFANAAAALRGIERSCGEMHYWFDFTAKTHARMTGRADLIAKTLHELNSTLQERFVEVQTVFDTVLDEAELQHDKLQRVLESRLRLRDSVGAVPSEIALGMIPVAILLVALTWFNVFFGFSIGSLDGLQNFNVWGEIVDPSQRAATFVPFLSVFNVLHMAGICAFYFWICYELLSKRARQQRVAQLIAMLRRKKYVERGLNVLRSPFKRSSTTAGEPRFRDSTLDGGGPEEDNIDNAGTPGGPATAATERSSGQRLWYKLRLAMKDRRLFVQQGGGTPPGSPQQESSSAMPRSPAHNFHPASLRTEKEIRQEIMEARKLLQQVAAATGTGEPSGMGRKLLRFLSKGSSASVGMNNKSEMNKDGVDEIEPSPEPSGSKDESDQSSSRGAAKPAIPDPALLRRVEQTRKRIRTLREEQQFQRIAEAEIDSDISSPQSPPGSPIQNKSAMAANLDGSRKTDLPPGVGPEGQGADLDGDGAAQDDLLGTKGSSRRKSSPENNVYASGQPRTRFGPKVKKKRRASQTVAVANDGNSEHDSQSSGSGSVPNKSRRESRSSSSSREKVGSLGASVRGAQGEASPTSFLDPQMRTHGPGLLPQQPPSVMKVGNQNRYFEVVLSSAQRMGAMINVHRAPLPGAPLMTADGTLLGTTSMVRGASGSAESPNPNYLRSGPPLGASEQGGFLSSQSLMAAQGAAGPRGGTAARGSSEGGGSTPDRDHAVNRIMLGTSPSSLSIAGQPQQQNLQQSWRADNSQSRSPPPRPGERSPGMSSPSTSQQQFTNLKWGGAPALTNAPRPGQMTHVRSKFVRTFPIDRNDESFRMSVKADAVPKKRPVPVGQRWRDHNWMYEDESGNMMAKSRAGLDAGIQFHQLPKDIDPRSPEARETLRAHRTEIDPQRHIDAEPFSPTEQREPWPYLTAITEALRWKLSSPTKVDEDEEAKEREQALRDMGQDDFAARPGGRMGGSASGQQASFGREQDFSSQHFASDATQALRGLRDDPQASTMPRTASEEHHHGTGVLLEQPATEEVLVGGVLELDQDHQQGTTVRRSTRTTTREIDGALHSRGPRPLLPAKMAAQGDRGSTDKNGNRLLAVDEQDVDDLAPPAGTSLGAATRADLVRSTSGTSDHAAAGAATRTSQVTKPAKKASMFQMEDIDIDAEVSTANVMMKDERSPGDRPGMMPNFTQLFKQAKRVSAKSRSQSPHGRSASGNKTSESGSGSPDNLSLTAGAEGSIPLEQDGSDVDLEPLVVKDDARIQSPATRKKQRQLQREQRKTALQPGKQELFPEPSSSASSSSGDHEQEQYPPKSGREERGDKSPSNMNLLSRKEELTLSGIGGTSVLESPQARSAEGGLLPGGSSTATLMGGATGLQSPNFATSMTAPASPAKAKAAAKLSPLQAWREDLRLRREAEGLPGLPQRTSRSKRVQRLLDFKPRARGTSGGVGLSMEESLSFSGTSGQSPETSLSRRGSRSHSSGTAGGSSSFMSLLVPHPEHQHQRTTNPSADPARVGTASHSLSLSPSLRSMNLFSAFSSSGPATGAANKKQPSTARAAGTDVPDATKK
ncbi:unnamed protein product [Amoebophrya sp. A120]|nr:unnamed protein product [Amoebophrya sp. A120]|eukprot:GSA120T00002279001.1